MTDLSQRLEGSDASLIRYHEVISRLGLKCEDARAELRDSKVEIAHLKAGLEVAGSIAEASRPQMLEATDQYLEGYEEALLHVQTLFPSLDLQPCKPYMRVEGGRLIDPTEEARARNSRGIIRARVDQAEECVANDIESLVELG